MWIIPNWSIGATLLEIVLRNLTILGLALDAVGALLLLGLDSQWVKKAGYRIWPQFRKMTDGFLKLYNDGGELTSSEPGFDELLNVIDPFREREYLGDTDQNSQCEFKKLEAKSIGLTQKGREHKITVSFGPPGFDFGPVEKRYSDNHVGELIENEINDRFTLWGARLLVAGFALQIAGELV